MLLAAPVVLLAILAAAMVWRPWDDGDHSPRLFIGVDRTGSYVRATGGNIEEDLGRVLGLCATSSCYVAADGLTGDTLGTSALPVSTRLRVPRGNAGGDENVNASLAGQIADEWAGRIHDELGFDRGATCSDVVSGFALAREAMASFASDGLMAIVMMTDGYSNCPSWDVVTAAMVPGGIDALLARMQDAGAFPDLHGVTVRIVGGGRSAHQHAQLSTEIRSFWERYLQAAGATLPPDWWRTRFDATALTSAGVGR